MWELEDRDATSARTNVRKAYQPTQQKIHTSAFKTRGKYAYEHAHDGSAFLRLDVTNYVDCTSLLPVEVSSLPRGLFARCVCFHPERPLLALGVASFVGGYDLLTGCRLGRVDVRTPAVSMVFSRDGSLLVVATQEWHIVGINTNNWKSRVLAPCRKARSAPLEACLLAITAGPRPLVFFCKYGKEVVRMTAVLKPSHGDGKAGSKVEGKWGIKTKVDVAKPVVGLASHPRDNHLLILHGDGFLRGYSAGGVILNPLYAIPLDPLGAKTSLSLGFLDAVLHPYIPGAALVLQGSRTGTLAVLELLGRSEPRIVLRWQTPGGESLVGLGLHQDSHTILAFLEKPDGPLRAQGWRIYGSLKTPGLTLVPCSIHLDALDGKEDRELQHQQQEEEERIRMTWEGSQLEAGEDPATSWQQLWNAGATWQDGGNRRDNNSQHLEKLLNPVVHSVTLHPSLGVIGVQRVPPPALRQVPAIMMQSLSHISPAEAAITRRTAAIPLLTIVSSHQPHGFWPGDICCPMHTGINFWQGGAGLSSSKLLFPCYLYFLSSLKVQRYSLVNKTTGAMVLMPDSNKEGRPHEARYILHSHKQNAWLVFFESMEPPTKVPGSAQRTWEFTLMRDGMAALASWFLPGKYGAFLGPEDQFFAIVAANSAVLSFYSTLTFQGKGPAAFTIALDNPSKVHPGILQGPPCLAVPEYRPEPPKPKEEDIQADRKEEGTPQKPTDPADAMEKDASSQSSHDDQEEGEGDKPEADTEKPEVQPGDEPEESPEDDPTDIQNGGCVMWVSAEGCLVMGQLPGPGVQYAAGDDSDDPDGSEATNATPATHHGKLHHVYEWPLLPGEKVLSVSWQQLTSEPPTEPNHCAAAVLTTQRLALLSGDLTLIASVSTGEHSLGLTHPITSFIWAGPSLLYMTAAGQVMQMTWTGTINHICSVASYPMPLLAGATADSLLLLRPTAPGGEWEVTSRPVNLLQPLLQGWCSLAASGWHPKGLGSARVAMEALLMNFDATRVTDSLLWALINSWCWDIASALANHASNVDLHAPTKLAAQAASGQWDQVVPLLMSEYERSVHYPGPVPRGLPLHSKLLAAAAGAIMHGQFSRAQDCLKSAGEWTTALTLAACRADFPSLREISSKMLTQRTLSGGGLGILHTEGIHDVQEAHDVGKLARALVSVFEQAGRTYSTTPAKDWSLTATMDDGTIFSSARQWKLGGPGRLPAMETSAFNSPSVQESDVGGVPGADFNHIASYLGVSNVTRTSGPSQTGLASEDGAVPDMDQSVSGANKSVASTASSDESDADAGGGWTSRTQFGSLGGDRKDQASSESDSDMGSDAQFRLSKFKIQIKSKEEAQGTPSNQGVDLKEAVKNLKLGGPGSLTPASSVRSLSGNSPGKVTFGMDSMKSSQAISPSPATDSSQKGPSISGGFGSIIAPGPSMASLAPPKPPAVTPPIAPGRSAIEAGPLPMEDWDLENLGKPTAPSPASKPPLPPAQRSTSSVAPSPAAALVVDNLIPSNNQPSALPSGDPTQLYIQGVQLMESGKWKEATKAFDDTMAALSKEPDSQARTSKLSFAAQYYAAVRLVETASKGSGDKEARLYRFASALKLDDKHQLALMHESVNRNKLLGNFRYCADVLTSMIAKCLGNTSMEYMAKLQEDIDECDRAGNVNKKVPRDENLEDFVTIVAACQSKSDVEEVLVPIMNA